MSRLWGGHGTVVAWVALFIALGGSGYAAVRIASAGGVKVRCSASHGRKKVRCQVVKGSGVGPQGPRGAQGPPGPAGPSGSTTLTEPPAYSFSGGGTFQWLPASGKSYDAGEHQEFTAYANANGTNVSTTLDTGLLSPSSLAGTGQHLTSVSFCYGAFNNTTPGGSAPSTISITGATVLEFSESGAGGTSAPAPPATGTTPEAPPYGTPVPLISQTFAPAISESYGCRTISASGAPAIAAGGYLSLVLGVSFSTGNWTGSDPEGTISLGRVTATYSP